MYEMQGPRQAGQRYPPIALAGWFAGAIGDPHAVRPTTGPGHLAKVPVARSPSPTRHYSLILEVAPKFLGASC
jgi:hypothetical protein